MTQLCQHCATPYLAGTGVDGFCCGGCQQVYALIQSEGLDDYYRRQDRAAQPLKDRSLAEVDRAALHDTQLQAEEATEAAGVGRGVFRIEGMSCMGCAWLTERLSRNQAGVDSAVARLSTYSLSLQWRTEAFDLAALGTELSRFGYRLDSSLCSARESPGVSPLLLRVLLTGVFAGNALLLAAYQSFVTSGEAGGGLVVLLSLVCLCFALMLGAAPFFMSVYRAALIRRWHSDCVAVGLMIAFGLYAFRFGMSAGAFLASLFVFVLILARWLGSMRSWSR